MTTGNAFILLVCIFAFFCAASSGLLNSLLPLFVATYRTFMFPVLNLIATGSQSLAVVQLINWLSGGLAAFSVGALLFLATAVSTLLFGNRKPTHIGVSQGGLWILMKVTSVSLYSLRHLAWDEVERIYLLNQGGKRSAKDYRICFKPRRGKPVKLRLGDIINLDDRLKLLQAIKSFAPRDAFGPELLDVLSPPAIQESYTELWLKQLAAPPRRQRLQPLTIGATLQDARYRIDAQIGMGGQGTVYLATICGGDLQPAAVSRTVALKEFILPIFPQLEVRKRAAQKFESEAKMLSALDHPQIVRLIDVFVEDFRAYLVLERAEGSSLRRLVQEQGCLSEARVRELAEQMCDILAYLHARTPAIIHRDFTPENLILCPDGKLKLIDFSVAEQKQSTVTGTMVGKHSYMPPEQFRGKPTVQSDIYALGATLFFLLSASDPEPIMQSHPRTQIGTVSPQMDALVARATAIEPVDRYPDVASVRQDLASFATLDEEKRSASGDARCELNA